MVALTVLPGGCTDSGDARDRASSTTTAPARSGPRFVDTPQDYTASGDFRTGHQIGMITAIDPEAQKVSVDFIQFLSGEAANRAYREDTGESDAPPNDLWIRNTSTNVRTYEVADDAPITVNSLGGHQPQENELIDLATLARRFGDYTASADGRDAVGPFGLTLKNGVITRIEQLYVP